MGLAALDHSHSAASVRQAAQVQLTLVEMGTTEECHLLSVLRVEGLECTLRRLVLPSEWSRIPSEARAAMSLARPYRASSGVLVEARERAAALRCARVLRASRLFARLPVLLGITSEQLKHASVVGGFDDFVVQPAGAAEILARMQRARQCRGDGPREPGRAFDEVALDPVAREAHIGELTLQLQPREFALLCCLCEGVGRVHSRQTLLTRVWGTAYRGGPRTVDTHIGRLRRKLGNSVRIDTVRAAGYRVLPRTGGEHGDHPPV